MKAKDNGRPCCTLCRASACAQSSLLTRTGDVYALCAECTPPPGREGIVADKCRETRLPTVGR